MKSKLIVSLLLFGFLISAQSFGAEITTQCYGIDHFLPNGDFVTVVLEKRDTLRSKVSFNSTIIWSNAIPRGEYSIRGFEASLVKSHIIDEVSGNTGGLDRRNFVQKVYGVKFHLSAEEPLGVKFTGGGLGEKVNEVDVYTICTEGTYTDPNSSEKRDEKK